jgi:flagellin-like protein
MGSFRDDSKGLSPVTAVVVLVSVTIVVAVSVAYWMGGIAGTYARLAS